MSPDVICWSFKVFVSIKNIRQTAHINKYLTSEVSFIVSFSHLSRVKASARFLSLLNRCQTVSQPASQRRNSYTEVIQCFYLICNQLFSPTSLLGYSNATVRWSNKDINVHSLKNHSIANICLNTVSCVGEHSGIGFLMLVAWDASNSVHPDWVISNVIPLPKHNL